MFTTTSRSINVFNVKDVRMLLVVDDDSGDQRSKLIFLLDLIKGNNKITELRTILQRESPNS